MDLPLRSRKRRNVSDSISFCIRALCSFETTQAKVHNLNTKIATPLFNARWTLVLTLLVAAALFAIGVALRRSFAGIGLSGELEQDWAQLLFLAAFAFAPVARRTLALTTEQRVSCMRNLTYAFAAAYAAFLLTTAMQGALAGGLAPLSTLIFPSINAGITCVLIMTLRADEAARWRGRIGRTLYGISLIYFWSFFAVLDYGKIGLSRLSDPFFMTAFALLVAALVLKVTDQWMLRRQLAEKVG